MSESPLLGPPRGMRDFYPADMALRNALVRAWTAASRGAGFEPYDACVVESLELLKRKGGEEIVDQIYAFVDKSGRELALRAEMTPTLARMVAARQNELAFPLKWFAVAQCFRYERMSRGRKREHYQWNLDIIGEESILAETEVIATALHALALLGLAPGEVLVHVNSRALLGDLLERAGIARAHHAAAFLALDKRGKIEDSAIGDLLREAGLDNTAIENTFRLLRIASLEDAEALLGGPTPALLALRELFARLADHGCGDAVRFDISVIRGLGYYTGVVFEGFDAKRELRALFGGGRYDNLLGDVGGKSATAVGLGFGDVVVGELLAAKGWHPPASDRCEFAIAFMEDAQRSTAVTIARALRGAGHSADLTLHAERPKNFFARAARAACRFAVYLGPDDIARGTARIKNLDTRSESEVALPDLLAGTLPPSLLTGAAP